MATRAAEVPPWISLESSSGAPYYRQLYDGVRRAILSGLLPAGTRLPSTRTLAAELGISRTTVVTAFEQLLAEGYLEGKVGSGTFVARYLPDDLLSVAFKADRESRPARSGRGLSGRGAVLAATPTTAVRDRGSPRAFRPGVPALDEFPDAAWRRVSTKVWRKPSGGLLGYGDPAGYRPLREAIARYLGASRAVRCVPEQVIVVSGSQQALDLAARVLLDPGDTVWVEDPGYMGARGTLSGAGARLVPVPVDGEGLGVAVGVARELDARLACVTPSHQYPLGVTMSLSRRLELLGWANRSGAWVVEDDYDSEYRYTGCPLEALQGLDSEGRVLYIGTFSKVLFPALRLGYLVVPSDLIDAFVSARADRPAPADGGSSHPRRVHHRGTFHAPPPPDASPLRRETGGAGRGGGARASGAARRKPRRGRDAPGRLATRGSRRPRGVAPRRGSRCGGPAGFALRKRVRGTRRAHPRLCGGRRQGDARRCAAARGGPGIGFRCQAWGRREMVGAEIISPKRYHQPRWGFAFGKSVAARPKS